MFRQTLLLACLIALATSASAWFAVGFREDGDQNIAFQTTQSLETEFPTYHQVNLLFEAGPNTFTYARFDVEEEWHSLDISSSIENGFNVTIGAYNATQLFAHASIFGFIGQGPVDFVPKKISSKSFRIMN